MLCQILVYFESWKGNTLYSQKFENKQTVFSIDMYNLKGNVVFSSNVGAGITQLHSSPLSYTNGSNIYRYYLYVTSKYRAILVVE